MESIGTALMKQEGNQTWLFRSAGRLSTSGPQSAEKFVTMPFTKNTEKLDLSKCLFTKNAEKLDS